MIHLPSCILLSLLIVIPGIQSGVLFMDAAFMAIPFALAAMGSFALNDYYDYEKDVINKPDRILPMGIIKRGTARKIEITLSSLAAVLAVAVSSTWKELLMYWATIVLSMLYSRYIKKISVIKGFYTAAVLAVPFAFAMVRWGNIQLLWVYILGVFLYVSGKEIIMDIFDYDGDKADGMRTIAIVMGKKAAFLIAFACHFGAFACFFSIYSGKSVLFLGLSVFVAVTCYALWLLRKRDLQRITIYLFWLPLVFSTIGGWMM